MSDAIKLSVWDGSKWVPVAVGGGGTGIPGPEGPQGPEGPPGRDGVDGSPGRDGVDGAPGADGQPGRDGKDGADGAPGRDGVDGAVGPPGNDGADGADGAPGRDGVDGAKGDKGDPGPTVVSADANNFAKLGSDGLLVVKQADLDDRYVLVTGDTMTGPLVVTAAPNKELDAFTIATDSGDLLYIGVKENPSALLGADAVIATQNGVNRQTLATFTAEGRIVFGEDTGDRKGRVFVDESFYGSAFYARTQHKFGNGLYSAGGETSAALSNFFAVAYPTVPGAADVTTSGISGLSVITTRNAVAGDAGAMSGNLNGVGIQFGHAAENPAFAGTTTNAVGILLQGQARAGTITNYVDIQISPPQTGGTATTKTAVLQLDTTSRNVFLSRVGVGQYPNPTRMFDVTGDAQIIGNFTVTTGTTVRFPARTVNYDCLGPLTIRVASADTTFALTDCSRAVLNASLTTGTVIYTIPDNTTVPIPIGSMIRVYDTSRLGTTAIQAATGVTLFWRNAAGAQTGGAAQTLTLPGEVNFVELIKTGTNTWYAFGDTK